MMANSAQREKHYQKPTITNGDFLAGILLGSGLSMSNIPLFHKIGISIMAANIYGQLENSRTSCIYTGEIVAGLLAWKFSNYPVLRVALPVALMLPKLIDANKVYITEAVTEISNKALEFGSNLFFIISEDIYDWANNVSKFLEELPDNGYLFQDYF